MLNIGKHGKVQRGMVKHILKKYIYMVNAYNNHGKPEKVT